MSDEVKGTGRPRRRPRWWLASLVVLLTIRPESTIGQNPARPPWTPPSTLRDPRLLAIREASASWERRQGPARSVVDQVCLVPDLATFFEAIATWDEAHYFPILIDDVESTLRFVRAFRPARVVRYPKAAAAIAPGQVWERARDAVAASWARVDAEGRSPPPGDLVPKHLGPTPPGVVLSTPEAPMLAGAVALAAGRFQPLRRVDFARQFGDRLSIEEFRAFDDLVTAEVRRAAPDHGRLGDDCDFLTLAGDWPYGYAGSIGGDATVEDGLGRDPRTGLRWAFAGRLLGDPARSVYRAMCSLFLQPEAVALFNGYDEKTPPWSDYSMRPAGLRLAASRPTAHVAGPRANVEGWHEVFDPANRYGLVLVNSSGGPTDFGLVEGSASVPDVPRSVPAAVLMIHSFSAARPNDPATVAGRWLANGAFVYFGSMTEPFLDAFRAPGLVGDLIAEGLPLVVAARSTLAEPRGTPWRLAFLGDPLYRVAPVGPGRPARLANWEPTARWPAYAEATRPVAASDAANLQWALNTTLARLRGGKSAPGDDTIDALLAIRRARLPGPTRPIFDALLADQLSQARRRGDLRARIAAIPEAERSPDLRRWFETIVATDFAATIARGDPSQARQAWADAIRSPLPREFKEQATTRVGRLATNPVRRHDWLLFLRAILRERPRAPEAGSVETELKRVEAASLADRSTAR